MFRKRRCQQCGRRLESYEYGLCTADALPGVLAMFDAEDEIRAMLPNIPIDELNPFQRASFLQRWSSEKPQTKDEAMAVLGKWLEETKNQ